MGVWALFETLAELSNNPQKDVGEIFDDIARAASLPAEEGMVALGDPTLPEAWWDHFRLLLDTDRQRPFRPQAPSSEDLVLCHKEIEAALALLHRTNPLWCEEVRRLLRMIVLGSPRSMDSADLFNGASTFFVGCCAAQCKPQAKQYFYRRSAGA